MQRAANSHVVLDTCSHPPAHLRTSTSLQPSFQRRDTVAVWSAGVQDRPKEDEHRAERVGGALAGELFKTRSARVMRRPAVEAQMAAAQAAMAAVRARVELRDLDGARSARVKANREAMLAGTCRSYVARCQLVYRAADGLRRLFPRGTSSPALSLTQTHGWYCDAMLDGLPAPGHGVYIRPEPHMTGHMRMGRHTHVLLQCARHSPVAGSSPRGHCLPLPCLATRTDLLPLACLSFPDMHGAC